jgi:hypothetical protein
MTSSCVSWDGAVARCCTATARALPMSAPERHTAVWDRAIACEQGSKTHLHRNAQGEI